MLKKIKFKIYNFVSRWKFENHLIKTCNRATPLHQKVCAFLSFVLCFALLLFFVGAISASADEGMTPRAVPTNLTGFTVTVPAGWSATAGYYLQYQNEGSFDFIIGDTVSTFEGIAIGFGPNFDTGGTKQAANQITFSTGYAFSYGPILPEDSFSLSNFTGEWATDTTFIQWLVDNYATFTGGSEPEPETSSIASGIYHFKTFGNLPDVPNPPWSNPEGYTYSYNVHGKLITTSRTIPFTFLDVTFDEYVSNSHYTVTFSFTTSDGVIDVATYSFSYGQCQLESRPDFKYFVFDEDFIDEYNDIEFIRQFLVSGFPDTDTSATDNPWAYILEMIIEALKVDLFGYFSVWDIFTTICGIFIVTWLLKLLAGG